MKTVANPGLALKELRLRKRWTLAEVSERTGLPISTLSKIENGRVSLSYDKLAAISTGLDFDISVLFSHSPPRALSSPNDHSSRRSINRAGDGQAIETDVYGHLYVAADILNKRFVPVIAEIRARSLDEFAGFIRHPGEEYAYVLEGAVELHTESYAPVRLNAGDSIYFDSGMGHIYIAVGEGPCKVLSICSGQESQIRAALDSVGQARALDRAPKNGKPQSSRLQAAALRRGAPTAKRGKRKPKPRA